MEDSEEIEICPECSLPVDAEELVMFNGMCESCREEMDNEE